MENKTVFVFMDQGTAPAVLVGRLFIDHAKGKENYSFEYDENWLSLPERFAIDPELPLYRGRQYPGNPQIYGIFQDASPNRWGKTLMQRKEGILARKEGRKPRKLSDSDYLLGVCDEARMGAIRLSFGIDEPFLSFGEEMSIPPIATLRHLEAASRAFENDESHLEEKWVTQLLAPVEPCSDRSNAPRIRIGRRKQMKMKTGLSHKKFKVKNFYFKFFISENSSGKPLARQGLHE